MESVALADALLEAVATAGLVFTPAQSPCTNVVPPLAGWVWDLGGDIRIFYHSGEAGHTERFRASYHAVRDTVGLKISVSGEIGQKYTLGHDAVASNGLDVMLLYLPRGFTMESDGAFCGRSVSLIMDLSWLRQTLGDRDPIIHLIMERRDGLVIRAPHVTEVMPRLFGEIASVSRLPRLTRSLMLRAKAFELLATSLDLLALSQNAEEPPAVDSHELKMVSEVVRKLRMNYDSELSIESLARMIGTNRTTLRNVFRRVTGRTMVQYRRECRMEFAESLLRAGRLPVAAVALEVGYAESATFCVAYRQFFGRTPGETRHKASKRRARGSNIN